MDSRREIAEEINDGMGSRAFTYDIKSMQQAKITPSMGNSGD